MCTHRRPQIISCYNYYCAGSQLACDALTKPMSVPSCACKAETSSAYQHIAG